MDDATGSRAAAFEEMKHLLHIWDTMSWGSSVVPTDTDVLEALKKIVDEFPGYGAFR